MLAMLLTVLADLTVAIGAGVGLGLALRAIEHRFVSQPCRSHGRRRGRSPIGDLVLALGRL